MGRTLPGPELIGCHDCSGVVSFSASRCPHCGSAEPTGPYVPSAREQKAFRAEEHNDRTVLGMTVLCTGVGVFLGALSGAVLTTLGYGLLGAIIGGPAAVIINVSRRLSR